MTVTFHSSLPNSCRDALERLVFFNPHQISMRGAIAHALDLYGRPEIVSGPQGLSVRVNGCEDAQCLFAVDRAREPGGCVVAGMLIYLRTSIEEVLVVHIAVSDRHGQTRRSGLSVAMRLIRELRAIARRLRGVQWLRLLYTDERRFQLRLKSAGAVDDREPTGAMPIRFVS